MREFFETARREGLTAPVAIQPQYSLVFRKEYEQDYSPIAREYGAAVFPYFSLAAGFLTGKYRTKEDLEGRARKGMVQDQLTEDALAVVDVLTEVAATHDAEPASVAIAWLLAKGKIKHSYPHSWRSKAPLIYRNTPQWFAAIDKPLADGMGAHGDTIRTRALSSIDKLVTWWPQSGRNRIHAMVENRPDWVLSRQRAWGVVTGMRIVPGVAMARDARACRCGCPDYLRAVQPAFSLRLSGSPSGARPWSGPALRLKLPLPPPYLRAFRLCPIKPSVFSSMIPMFAARSPRSRKATSTCWPNTPIQSLWPSCSASCWPRPRYWSARSSSTGC